MIIYRLEDSQGRGPLAGCGGLHNCFGFLACHDGPDQLARRGGSSHSLDEVQEMLNSRQYIFAWNSMESVLNFCESPFELSRAGFHIMVYDTHLAEIVTFCDGQIMFSRNEASVIGGFGIREAIEFVA